ncbi:uncharacterized protein LOC128962102 [Oppia nitens]|uniref:uncharacterized protein LOC128962102 n=1 Tax=Oppia nitens TaxID=1686743 RepID=UPI0023DAC146|nr:uncharacterized protein LOC128962102 [Oppia nitens]
MTKVMALPVVALLVLTIASHPVISDSTIDLETNSDTLYDTESLCKGEWKFPYNCNTFNCDYKASWEYLDDNDEIMFTISTKNRNKWTGIGFSDNQAMPDTDAVLGLVEESGRFFLMDSWLRAYEAPPLDQSQNLYNMSAWRENGITTLRFFRKRLTGDNRDFQFSDTNCPYLVFPVMGGVFNAVNKRIRKHETTPLISDRRICIKSCRAPTTTTTTANPVAKQDTDHNVNVVNNESVPKTTPEIKSTQPSNEIIKDKENNKTYRITIKLPEIWTQSMNNKNSETYKTMSANIQQHLQNEMQTKKPRELSKLNVKQLIDLEADSNDMVATFELDVQQSDDNNQNLETTVLLTNVLNSILSDELLGELKVNPNYLIIDNKKEVESNFIKDLFGLNLFNEDQLKWFIIFVGIAALIVLVIIQACCMLWRDSRARKEKNKNEQKTAPDSQWKDYAAMSARNGYSGYDNYGASDENDAPLNTSARNDTINGKKQYYKNNAEKMPHKYMSATLERQPSRTHRPNDYPSAYATHDRKEIYNRHYNQPSLSPQLQPDFYFMPHQRRYSGEVVRVFVDYNNPQFAPK